MQMNLWDRPNLGEFVAANRVQLVFLLEDSQAAKRQCHIDDTLAGIEKCQIQAIAEKEEEEIQLQKFLLAQQDQSNAQA